jgi:hypothetical protein
MVSTVRFAACPTYRRSAAAASANDEAAGGDDRASGSPTTGSRHALQIATRRGRLLQRFVGRRCLRLGDVSVGAESATRAATY